MLRSLSIRDVVLIDRLSLTFEEGLAVLTGETGAGKSILLDSLGLATGARAEARLVRTGAQQASATAVFDTPRDGGLLALLNEQGIPLEDGELILRRTLSADGRSRAFINDTAISVTLLRQIGEALVEVHGQFDNQRLTNPARHLDLLDGFAELKNDRTSLETAWKSWRDAINILTKAEAGLAGAKRDEDFLRHAMDELTALAPKPGEDNDLAVRRQRMMNAEKLIEGMNEASGALSAGDGVEGRLQSALGVLSRLSDQAGGAFDEIMAALDRALTEAVEVVERLERASREMDLDPALLEQTEERLFALRACARKHGVQVDSLPALKSDFEAKLAALETGEGHLKALRDDVEKARAAYIAGADALSAKRQAAASRLDAAMAAELAPLKLGGARFVTSLEGLNEKHWGSLGKDKVSFQVVTNAGAAPGPLNRIASGGELARFMLALKVVLAETDSVPSLVFDEVDAGIGGATAAAVGERLAKLANNVQVLVVTHSPQVAAQGAAHFRVAKQLNGGMTETRVAVLSADERQEEIARMLAGSEITNEARAAAGSLLDAANG